MKPEWKPAGTITRITKSRVYHAPVRSSKELAVEFGVSCRSLAAILLNDASAPRPNYASTAGTFYDYAKVKKWWAARK